MTADLGVKVFVVAYSCRNLWRLKLLQMAAAYTFYGAADQNILQLMAYKVYGGG